MSYVNNLFRWILYLIALLFLMSFAGCTDARNLETTTEDITTTEELTTLEPETCQFNIDIEVSGVIEDVVYDTIEPTFFMCVASGTNPNNQFTADGLCLYGFDMVEQKDTLPSINQLDTMEINVDQGTNIIEIQVFDSEGTLIETWDDWASRDLLSSGEYFIRLELRNVQDDCWVEGYAFFVMTVPTITENN